MKLYYLTSNLNIDNILSSECLSPYSFYREQNFGYRNIEELDELSFAGDYILLFSQIPNFDIHDQTRENHPMVLEIEDDSQITDLIKVNEYHGCEVFAYNKSIYITPWNCSFLFFDKKSFVLSKTKCSDSANNKHFAYYRMNISTPCDFFLDEIIANCNTIPANQNVRKLVSLDNCINKAKGFIFGFFIGRLKSVSHNTAMLQRIQGRIYDIVASVKNNGGMSSRAFNEELISLDREYSKYDINAQKARDLWNEEVSTKLGCDAALLDSFLNEYGIQADLKWKFCEKKGIEIRKSPVDITSLSGMTKLNDSVLADVNKKVSSDITEKRLTFDFCNTISKMSYDYPYMFLEGTDKDTEMYNKILKNIFWDNLIPSFEYLRTNRFECSTEVTKAIKSILENMGVDWETSQAKSYFNALRKNIKNYDPFDVNQTENNVYKAIASFILKGESFEAMDIFMRSNAIERYDYAYGMWGAIMGYASISRIYTDNIVGDKSLYLNEYKNIQELIFNDIRLESEWPIVVNPILTRPEEEPHKIATFLHEELPKKIHTSKVEEAIEKAAKLEDKVHCPSAFMMILNNLLSTRSKTYKSLKEAGLYEDEKEYSLKELKSKIISVIGTKEWIKNKEIIEHALELEERKQDPTAFKYILDDFQDKDSKAYKKILELLASPKFMGIQSPTIAIPQQTEIDFSSQGGNGHNQSTDKSNSFVGNEENVLGNSNLIVTINKTDKLDNEHKKENKIPQINVGRSLKPLNKTSELFVDDINATNFIWSRTYFSLDIRNVLCKKVVEFQNDYAPGGYYYGREDSPRTNDNTIKHFIHKCTYKKENSTIPSWIPATVENKTLLEKLKVDLYERYGH